MPAPLAKGPISSRVADDLGRRIVGGEYAPGDALKGEMEACQAFGVSRPAYREALRVLAAKGLISSRRQARSRVNPIANWSLLDPDVVRWGLQGPFIETIRSHLNELRLAIEPAAAELAAKRRTLTDIGLMRVALQRRDDQASSVAEADRAFRLAVVSASGNLLFRNFASCIDEATSVEARSHAPARLEQSLAVHWRVFDAIAAGAPADARSAMETLIACVGEAPMGQAPLPGELTSPSGRAL